MNLGLVGILRELVDQIKRKSDELLAAHEFSSVMRQRVEQMRTTIKAIVSFSPY